MADLTPSKDAGQILTSDGRGASLPVEFTSRGGARTLRQKNPNETVLDDLTNGLATDSRLEQNETDEKNKIEITIPAATITGATHATPIVITTALDHGYKTGDTAFVSEVAGNTAANGQWIVTVLTSTTLSLNTSVGNATYTGGGFIFPVIIQETVSEQVRGRIIVGETLLAHGALDPDSGAGVIESVSAELFNNWRRRTTQRFAGDVLPPNEVFDDKEYIGLPGLLLGVNHIINCNGLSDYSVANTTNIGNASLYRGPMTILCPVKTVVWYSATSPTVDTYPNGTGVTFFTTNHGAVRTADVRYEGVYIRFAFNNVLCDELVPIVDGVVAPAGVTTTTPSGCAFIDVYDFPATNPPVTDADTGFITSGKWYQMTRSVRPFGVSAYKITDRFYLPQ